MTAPKFTPGPWTADRSYRVDPDYGRTPLIVPEQGENPIAEITNDYIDEALWANARLIAAAPELYECLEAAIKIIGHPDDSVTKHFVSVLAKARGESSA